ncbi:MAG: ATP-binding protein [Sciscionella sp.]
MLTRLGEVERRVRALVAERRFDDPAPDDPFRGLYLSAQIVEWILARQPETVAASPRLPAMAEAFGLDELDVSLLLTALAPELDARFEHLYGYLNDDVSRRRATIGLALELCELPAADPVGRARLAPGSPLLHGGLLVVEDEDRPLLGRSLRVPDRVTAHLLGDDRADPDLLALLGQPPVGAAGDPHPLSGALRRGVGSCYLREQGAGGGIALAAAALREAGYGVLFVDLTRLVDVTHLAYLARIIAREATLTGSGVVVGPVNAVPAERRGALRALCELAPPVLLTGSGGWDPHWTAPAVPLCLDVPAPSTLDRRQLWRAQLNGAAAPDLDPAAETDGFRLGPEQIERAARAAIGHAALTDSPVTGAELRAGARAQNSAGLERLARRIVPRLGWADLVLPPPALGQLHELAVRVRHRERVLREWSMRPGGGRGIGVTALFTGESGTGKTTAAEVVATELGLDLYAVDLASVVDKYVGETEKNLERIFTEAAEVNGVLLFDEADAIFGKRSSVSDSHDRYANIESAYLLQRMESFDGLAILATNLRANLDEAFTRRLDMLVDFPLPDVRMRLSLWETCLGTALPRTNDLDLDYCARAFDLAGGDIRSAAITAAYAAAAANRPVTQADLIQAAEAEYRKLGRLQPVPDIRVRQATT